MWEGRKRGEGVEQRELGRRCLERKESGGQLQQEGREDARVRRRRKLELVLLQLVTEER